MFWNLTLEPGKKYSSTIEESFHLSMAALDANTAKNDNDIYPVLLKIDGKDTVLCNLNRSQFLQVNLDHMFEKGSKITFYTTGKATIHLTGYLVQDEMDSSDLSDDQFADLTDSSVDEASVKKALGDFKSETHKKNKRKSEVAEEVAKKKSKPKSGDDDEKGVDMSMNTLNHKKTLPSSDTDEEDDDDDDDDDDESSGDGDSDENITLGDDEDDDDDDDDDDEDEDDEDDDDESDSEDSDEKEDLKPKAQKTPQQTPKKKPDDKTPIQGKNNLQKQTPGGSNKKQNKQQNQSLTNGATPKSEKKDNKGTPQQKQGGGSPQKRTLAGGVHVEDLKTGNGPVAKPGKMVAVYYTGRLKTNNRVFDQTQKGPGFKFRLGKGEVIKGWDVGVAGMTVGSKRRITCPASMAYGSKGSPPEIPPNATLVFDVELKGVNN